MPKPRYILIDGIDGGGKSTLALELVNRLQAANQVVWHLAFPSRASAVGALIRDAFEGKTTISPEAMLWLFVAEGKDLEHQVRQHLALNKWIVCDRHCLASTFVYQAETHGVDRVKAVVDAANFQLPDKIYLIDVPPEVALERRAKRGIARNVLYEPEQVDRLQALRAKYLLLLERFPTAVLLDGRKPTSDTLEWICHDLGIS